MKYLLCLLLCLAAGCQPRLRTHTLVRQVHDTLVISAGARVDTLWHCADTLTVDTGRLHLQLIPLPTGNATKVLAQCRPDTIKVPKLIREWRTETRTVSRKGFWYYSGIAGWGLLLLILLIIVFGKIL